jgi:predicted phage-related endonuclease
MSTAQVTSKVVKVVQEAVVENTAVELDANAQALVNEYISTRTMVTELEKTKKELEAQVKELLGDAEVALVDGKVRLQVSKRQREGTDRKILAELFPEAYEATKTNSEYVVLVAK